MGLSEIFILGFLIILGLLAFVHSRRVTREIKNLTSEKNLLIK
jgi:hypothetical protein